MARRRRNFDPNKQKKRECYFTQHRIEYIDYKDVALLSRFVNERGKIRSARTTGTSPQYQKLLSEAIKNAREMALMPYSTR